MQFVCNFVAQSSQRACYYADHYYGVYIDMNPVDVLQIAENRLLTLNTELARLRTRERELERFLANSTLMDPDDVEWISWTYRLARENGKNRMQATIDAIQVILKNAKSPMWPQQILKRLRTAGISTDVTTYYIGGVLCSARPRFDNSSGNGWEIPNASGPVHDL